MPTCSIDGCHRKRRYVRTGWCQTHYHRWWRTGSLIDPVPQLTDWWTSASYRTCHARVKATLGKAKAHPCIACGEQADEWSYDGTDPSQLSGQLWVHGKFYPVYYSRFPEFYAPYCFGCHRARDAAIRAVKRTECARGHALTPANTYTPPRTENRECRTCRRDIARERARIQREKLRAQGLTARGTVPKVLGDG
jgi:hypothetical protein